MAATCHLGRERGVGNGGERTEGGRKRRRVRGCSRDSGCRVKMAALSAKGRGARGGMKKKGIVV